MTDDLVYKTIRLPLAKAESLRSNRHDAMEHAARVQAHINRVHPQLAVIRQEEARAELLPPIERIRKSTRKWRAVQIVRANLRAKAIASVKGLTRDER